ncbi:MAG: AAA family ATPase [Treponema sp.]|nr:MAG: AAA family ATPase [Treponema sp.]
MNNQHLIKQNRDTIDNMAPWSQELSIKYCSKTTNLYLVHGNIRDFLPHKIDAGQFMFVRIQDYIAEVIFGNKDIIIFYNKSTGISFCLKEVRKDYINTMSKLFPNEDPKNFFSRNPFEAFRFLETYFMQKIGHNLRIILIIDYAEAVVPAAEISKLDEVDRYSFVTFHKWSHDPKFTDEDISIIMLTENLNDVNCRLVASPTTVKIEIPLPDEETRTNYLRSIKNKKDKDLDLILDRGVCVEALGKLSSGLNLFNLKQLIGEAFQDEKPITIDYLTQKKRKMIEAEAAGLLEFVLTQHNLDYIAGHEFVKKRFKLAAKALKTGRIEVMPMGYLIAGPIGTGKTFMVSAFANEIGVPMVKLKNLQSRWKDSAESGLEKILTILKAMSPVAVMIDEADMILAGGRGKDAPTENAGLVAQLINFMGNTEYRGKIIWFLITSRPDLIPIDLKRQGRAEEHLALFYPQNTNEKIELFKTLQKKLRIKGSEVDFAKIVRSIKFSVSGADIESILVRARMQASSENRVMITTKDLLATIADFIPPTYPYEIELQNIVAALECTSKEMLPDELSKKGRTELLNEMLELKQLMGEK